MQGNDRWSIIGYSRGYSSIQMYAHMMRPSKVNSLFQDIWKSACRLRHQIFFWLLLHDRVNSRNLLHRKSMVLDSYNCALCADSTEETNLHLFWDCPFSLLCWDKIIPNRKRGISVIDDIQLALHHLPQSISLEIIIMGCWGICSVRNEKIFRHAASHVQGWSYYLPEGLNAVQIRSKQAKAQRIRTWLEQHF